MTDEDAVDRALAELIPGLRARMAEPHRHHHGQAHVDAMLRGLGELGDAVLGRAAARLAVWYHDAVYDPAKADDEAASADLLRREVTGRVPDAVLDDAVVVVLATAGHAVPPGTRDGLAGDVALVLDLDMAVLGALPRNTTPTSAGSPRSTCPCTAPRPTPGGGAPSSKDWRRVRGSS